MSSWKVINDQIKACRKGPHAEQRIQCLTRLLQQVGRDGMILFALGEEYERLGNKAEAAKLYSEAEEKFPLPEFKQQARRALLRIGFPIPEVPLVERQGLRTIDGHSVRSRAEVMIDDWLYSRGILHEYEKKVPVEDFIICDFYLPEYDAYLEYWGMQDAAAQERKRDKLELYERNQLRIISIDDNDLTNLERRMSQKLRFPPRVAMARSLLEDRKEYEVTKGQENYASLVIEKLFDQLQGDVIGILDYIDETTFAYLDKVPKASGIRILTSNAKETPRIRDGARTTARKRPFLKVIQIGKAKLHMRWIGAPSSFFIDIGTDLKSDALGKMTHTIKKIPASLFNVDIERFNKFWEATDKQLSDLMGEEVQKELIFDSATAK